MTDIEIADALERASMLPAVPLYEAASIIRRYKHEHAELAATAVTQSARIEFLEKHQQKERYIFGMCTPLMVFLLYCGATSLPWRPTGFEYPALMVFGALVLLFAGIVATIGFIFYGLSSWLAPKEE